MSYIFEKSEKSKTKKKSMKPKFVKRKIGGNKLSPRDLFRIMVNKRQDGWDVLSKQKPVATLNSGGRDWFFDSYNLYTEEEKRELLNYISEFLSHKNQYETIVRFYNLGGESFFLIPIYLRKAIELVGYNPIEAVNIISDPGMIYGPNNNSNKNEINKRKRLIHLVFGDYYKPLSFKQTAIETEGFMDLLRRYNAEVGLLDPDSLPMYNQEY